MLRRLELLAAAVREGRRPCVAAAGSIMVSCGALIHWTATGDVEGSVMSRELWLRNS